MCATCKINNLDCFSCDFILETRKNHVCQKVFVRNSNSLIRNENYQLRYILINLTYGYVGDAKNKLEKYPCERLNFNISISFSLESLGGTNWANRFVGLQLRHVYNLEQNNLKDDLSSNMLDLLYTLFITLLFFVFFLNW